MTTHVYTYFFQNFVKKKLISTYPHVRKLIFFYKLLKKIGFIMQKILLYPDTPDIDTPIHHIADTN